MKLDLTKYKRMNKQRVDNLLLSFKKKHVTIKLYVEGNDILSPGWHTYSLDSVMTDLWPEITLIDENQQGVPISSSDLARFFNDRIIIEVTDKGTYHQMSKYVKDNLENK